MEKDLFQSLIPIQRETHLKKLNSYEPRPYQVPILKALDKGYKRVLAILPRRSGKDITALNYVIKEMYEHPGVYYYIFPTYSQAKKVIWDSITNEGRRILEYFPADLVIQKNSQEMKIRMESKYGSESLFQLVGSDNYDSLVGTNPRGCVFSEYALQDPRAYQYIRPILTANRGWALFISTPRGKNHLWELSHIAEKSPEWFYMKLTLKDTEHIPVEEIDRERREGLMSEDMIQQEYYCSFEMGVEGSYYNKYLDVAHREGRVTNIPWQNGFPVHTSWDIGRDMTSIIFFQLAGGAINIIDCYEEPKQDLSHFAKLLKEKPYLYGKHYFPHDMRIKEWGTGMSRIEKARQLGIEVSFAPEMSLEDGIECVRSTFSRLYFDKTKTKPLLNALENYRQEYDSRRRTYRPKPLHDFSSHFADSMRYLCLSLPKSRDGLTAEDYKQAYNEALYGNQAQLPRFYQT